MGDEFLVKSCSRCLRADLPQGRFAPSSWGFRTAVCLDCRNARHRERLATDPEYKAARGRHNRKVQRRYIAEERAGSERRLGYRLKYCYGLSVAQYKQMYSDQGGKCAICVRPFDLGGPSGLFVDHNHTTGAVRALLCPNCNAAVGMLGESPERALGLAAYLKAHS